MITLDGKKTAQKIRTQLIDRVRALKKQNKVVPGLAVIVVGDNPASHIYVNNKEKACREIGMQSFRYNYRQAVDQQEIEQKISELNLQPEVHGILIQLPLPAHLNTAWLLDQIHPTKDVDGLGSLNTGKLWTSQGGLAPCTPKGIMTLLSEYQITVSGKTACIVGRSNIVGKPMAQLLLNADATVTICHSKTSPATLRDQTLKSDIVVVASGRPRLLGRGDFKQNAVVIDVGIHRVQGSHGTNQICGDVRVGELTDWVSAATPVPGGVGPMTIAMLLENTVILTERAASHQ